MFIFVHESLTAIEIDNNNSNCEVIWAEVQTQGKPITIGAFYRPPSAKESSLKDLACSIQNIKNKQRRAARFVFNDYKPLSSVTSMASQLGWKPLTERRREHRLSLFYKIINGLVAIPADTHLHLNTRNTRISKSKSLKLPICTTDTFKHSFFPATIRDWNLLPDDVVNCKNMSPFKETMRKSRD